MSKNYGEVWILSEVIKGIKVKIVPNDEQKESFHKNFGCCRNVYNLVLGKYISLYQQDDSVNPTETQLNKILNKVKKEYPYLKETESTSLQQSVRDLGAAFNNFFKKEASRFPKFHKKKNTRLSFRQTIPPNKKIIQGNKLSLRKYGTVKIKTSPEYIELLNNPETKFNNITISYDGLKYYATINIKTTVTEWELTGEEIGCDINSNRNGWLVTSKGLKEYFNIDCENQMIKKLNRLMSRTHKGSRKHNMLHKRLLKWYQKRTNKLNDYLHKLSSFLVETYDTIVFEENYAEIKILIGGEQNLIFPLSRFIEILQYKFQWYKPKAEGVVFVNPKYTSKTCHKCGHINHELERKTRNWKCPNCKTLLDRDINAAINILNRWRNGDSLETAKINAD